MKPAWFLIVLLSLLFVGAQTIEAASGGAQICNPSSSCTVGEFLYNDSYSPISDATCTLTSKYPDGSAYLTSQAMTGGADGWYSYSFTAPATTGYYRAQVCCTTGADYLCLDKSFEVKSEVSVPSTSEIATAIWGYSGRTLSSFGTLVADLWGSASSTNVTNITTDVTTVKETVEETRKLIEQLVNKPIIESSLEEIEDLDLSEKIDQTKTLADQLFINQGYINGKIGQIASRWNLLSEGEILDSLTKVSELMGEEQDSSANNSFLGQISWLKEVWGWSQADELYEQAKAVKRTLAFVQEGISTNGKNPSLYKEVKNLKTYLESQDRILGDELSAANPRTIFGKIKETESVAASLEQKLGEVDQHLAHWQPDKAVSLRSTIDDLVRKILAINKLPRVSLALSSNYKNVLPLEKKLKNKLLGARAILITNQKLLLSGNKKMLSSTWLEEGSIVIKTLVTNPSSLVSQEVPLKYYLPKEVKKEDVIEVDQGLSIGYDSEKDQYYISGNFTLSPNQTRTFSVRVSDVWQISTEKLDSLKNQAVELSKPLEKTAFFAQGVTLKSDIDVSLDKISMLVKEATTPEAKIKAYREAQIELSAVNTKMDKLQELVTQASGAGSLLGFVGGSQAIAVWGIIIVVAAGFIFLSIYMRTIINHSSLNQGNKNSKENKNQLGKVAKLALPMIVSAIVSSAVTSYVIRRSQPVSLQSQPSPAGAVMGEKDR